MAYDSKIPQHKNMAMGKGCAPGNKKPKGSNKPTSKPMTKPKGK